MIECRMLHAKADDFQLAVTWTVITLITVVAFLAGQISLAIRNDEG